MHPAEFRTQVFNFHGELDKPANKIKPIHLDSHSL